MAYKDISKKGLPHNLDQLKNDTLLEKLNLIAILGLKGTIILYLNQYLYVFLLYKNKDPIRKEVRESIL